MPEISPLTWFVGITALVVGILAGHYGWGKRFTRRFTKLDPDYLAGLDYLVTEQPDRALDTFLKLMDANAETLETHFALGSLYRRRGEVERAIRIHQNLLSRDALAPEHREQALLALAHDYLRAGLLDRAEELFQQVSQVPRLRARALDSLRGVYERQLEWQQALTTYGQLARIDAAPPRFVAAHYLCELAALAIGQGEHETAKRLLREARREVATFPRAAVLRSRIAESEADLKLAIRLLREALAEAPKLMLEELPHLLGLVPAAGTDAVLRELVVHAGSEQLPRLKNLVFAAIAAGVGAAEPLRGPIDTLLERDPMLRAVWGGEARRMAAQHFAVEVAALLESADKYRCSECGFSGRSFYWHCPACHAWESFEAFAIVKLG
jgi:lipopolysaccharide assembly protein B